MIYVSHQVHPQCLEDLKKLDTVTTIYERQSVHPQIASHCDLFYCPLPDGVFQGDDTTLSPIYPKDIGYNGAWVGDFFIHRLEFTNKKLLKHVGELGLIPINVSQGYTKCNLVIANDSSVITSDVGIAHTLKEYPIDVLLIEPKQVLLPGFPYGFLGGTSGKVQETLFFHGDLSSHSDFKKIESFLQKKEIPFIYYSSFPLTDIGSIISSD